MSKKKKIIVITRILILLVGIALGFGLYAWFNPHFGTIYRFSVSSNLDTELTRAQAKEDINFVIRKLHHRHPAWLEKENARVDEVDRRYEALVASLPDSMTVFDLYNEIGKMLSPLHDGHSYIFHMSDGPLYVLDDFSYLRTYGGPLAINGENINDIANRYLEQQSYEIKEDELKTFFSNKILMKRELDRIGIDTSNGVDYTYDMDGVETVIHHNFVIYEASNDSESEDTEPEKWVFYDIDAERNLGIFVLTTCDCNQEYQDTVDAFFEEVDAAGITNIAIDLRNNGGGNSSVGNYFIRHLDVDSYKIWDDDIRYGSILWKNRNTVCTNERLAPTFTGNVYVLTNRSTYSAAMDFTMLIMDNQIGYVVGEASSNLPDSYGDCLYYSLPNSKLNLSVSYKRWYRLDLSKAGQQLIPDYECNPNFALERVYELIEE